MANLCKYVSVLCVLIFLKSSSHVSGEITAEAVYETLSFSIFKIKAEMENLKRRFENMEERGQRISTTSFPQLAGRPIKEEDNEELKEYLNLQALAVKKTLAAEKMLLRETVKSFEVKFADFISEVQKDITSIHASLAVFKSDIQKDISSINASVESKAEAMTDILNKRSSAFSKDMAELTADFNNKTGNISLFLETMERTMMSNFGDIRARIANISIMQKTNWTWNDWGSWCACSVDTGYGIKRRERTCSSPTGYHCNGDTTEYQICNVMSDCEAIYRSGTRYDGVYDISPDGQKSFPVYCDMTNGGWTLIQKRIDDSVPFNRTWSEYETGFGDLQGSHWLGLDKIHRLTRNGSQIRFDMEQVDGSKVYAQYKSFRVDNATTAYTMHVDKSGYKGSIPELLSYHDGMKFSTFDRDNDPNPSDNCSQWSGYGGWWYNVCYKLGNLNGLYGINNNKGFSYTDFSAYWYLKTASIKVKGL